MKKTSAAFSSPEGWILLDSHVDVDPITSRVTFAITTYQAFYSFAIVFQRNYGYKSVFVSEVELNGYKQVDQDAGLFQQAAGSVFGANANTYTDPVTGWTYEYRESSNAGPIDNGAGLALTRGVYNAFDRGIELFPESGPGIEDPSAASTQYWESAATYTIRTDTHPHYGTTVSYGVTNTSSSDISDETGEWIGVNLPHAIKPTTVSYISTDFTKSPRAFKLFAWDGAAWIELHSETNVESSTVVNTFVISNSNADAMYSKFLFIVSQNWGAASASVAELMIAGNKQNSCDTWDLFDDWDKSNSTHPAYPYGQVFTESGVSSVHSYVEHNVDGGVRKGSDQAGNTCVVEGQAFNKCYTMKPNTTNTARNPLGLAQLWFWLNNSYPYTDTCRAQFKAFIGLTDDVACGGTGQVNFYVKVSGFIIAKYTKNRITEPGMLPGASYIEVVLPAASDQLELEVDYGDNSDTTCDYAMWGNPIIDFCGCGTASPTCEKCIPGKYQFTNCYCENCDPGKYQTQGNQTSCLACEACPAGKKRTVACAFDNPGACEDCPVGEYTPYADMWNCDACPHGHFNDQAGSSSCSVCKICPPGKKSVPWCPGNQDTECEDCESGKFQVDQDQLACIDCPVCLEGMYRTTVCGGPTALGCSACTKCPAGRYRTQYCNSTHDNSVCEDCPAGEYTSVAGRPVCNTCPR